MSDTPDIRATSADRTVDPSHDPVEVPFALELLGLRFRYPDGTPALDGVDLRVAAGERVALVGPNGAGKTTLALHTNGLLRADEGTVRVSGVTLGPETLREVRRRVGFVFQDAEDQLFMSTVRDDVAFGPANAGLRGAELDARVATALDALGVTHLADRAPHHLSGGEQRRVAIATVLALRPDVVVLDEPTAGLDPASRRELIETLEALEVAQLIVTHDLPLVLELCPRTVLVDAGRVVADGPSEVLLADEVLLAAHRLELPYARRTGTRGVAPSSTIA
jgi:cobalt/nickel transport system ATP-binding protein